MGVGVRVGTSAQPMVRRHASAASCIAVQKSVLPHFSFVGAQGLLASRRSHQARQQIKIDGSQPVFRSWKRGQLVLVNSGSDDPGNNSNRRSPARSGRPWSWLQRLVANWKLGQPLRILFNIMFIFFLMRMWPLGGRTGTPENETVMVQVAFSEFVRKVKSDEVHSVAFDGLHITYTLKPTSPLVPTPPEGSKEAKVSFSTVRPADYNIPYEVLETNQVQFSALDRRGNKFMTILVYALYIGLLLTALNRLPIKLPQKGTGRKHKGQGTNNTITFDDVAGVDEAKEELAEIVEYLRAPERFSKLGARPPSGVLLVGPPGTGKTLLARAVAGEADVPFFSISASEFVELYVGMGAMRVRELFANARKEAPAIVFIDEIDAVAKGRDMRLRSVGNDEREQTLNQLLTELDGFDSDQDNVVICIAATNRPDVLDTALLRPGRFDRRVAVERPDKVGREQILKVHLEKKGLPLSSDVAVSTIAAMTTGFTGADLANLVNEAALLAGRRHRAEVSREEFDMAILRAVAGIEKKRSILQGIEKDTVSKHEVGHALVSTAVAKLVPTASEVEKLSIIPRSGGALGFTYMPPKTEDRALLFDSEIRGQLAMLLGGRAAEHLFCHAISTGAVDDIRRATDLAYKAVTEYGLSSAVGPLNVGVLASGGGEDGAFLLKDSGDMSRLVEREVKGLLEGALAVAIEVVEYNQNIHEGLSNYLTKEERVEGDALQEWLSHVQVPEVLEKYVLLGEMPDKAAMRRLPVVSTGRLLPPAAAVDEQGGGSSAALTASPAV